MNYGRFVPATCCNEWRAHYKRRKNMVDYPEYDAFTFDLDTAKKPYYIGEEIQNERL